MYRYILKCFECKYSYTQCIGLYFYESIHSYNVFVHKKSQTKYSYFDEITTCKQFLHLDWNIAITYVFVSVRVGRRNLKSLLLKVNKTINL